MLKVAALVFCFCLGVLLSRGVKYYFEDEPQPPQHSSAYFEGCVDGLMTAAALSGVPLSLEAHKDNVVQICNKAYTRRYNESSYTWVTKHQFATAGTHK